jgi:hypothetical protein
MKSLPVFALAVICPVLLAQQILDNASVIRMVAMGFSEDAIVAAINRSPGSFNLSTDGVIDLKSSGVGEKALAAMELKAVAPVTSVPITRPEPHLSPATPPQQQVPSRQPVNEPRVFLRSKSHGSGWTATRNQTMTMSNDFQRSCPSIKITLNERSADYTVALNHIESGLFRDNQIRISNKQGDLIGTRQGGSISGGVVAACNLILANWGEIN